MWRYFLPQLGCLHSISGSSESSIIPVDVDVDDGMGVVLMAPRVRFAGGAADEEEEEEQDGGARSAGSGKGARRFSHLTGVLAGMANRLLTLPVAAAAAVVLRVLRPRPPMLFMVWRPRLLRPPRPGVRKSVSEGESERKLKQERRRGEKREWNVYI